MALIRKGIFEPGQGKAPRIFLVGEIWTIKKITIYGQITKNKSNLQ